MKLYAVLSDIHGNFDALQAVHKDACDYAQQEYGANPRFIILGDMVDYGPQPNECIKWLNDHQSSILYVIQGNHDRETARPLGENPIGMGDEILPMTQWTQRVLQDEYKEKMKGWKPSRVNPPELLGFTLFHSSVVGIDSYLDNLWSARKNLQSLQTPYGLFGHTHVQGCFTERDVMFTYSGEIPDNPEGWWPIEVGQWQPLPKPKGDQPTILLNPGSVGQPRLHALLRGAGISHDYRAAYMLLRLDDRQQWWFQFRRVDYPVEETTRKLQNLPWPEPDDPGMRQRLSRLVEKLVQNLQRQGSNYDRFGSVDG
jgi:predicted phosphodiesterase